MFSLSQMTILLKTSLDFVVKSYSIINCPFSCLFELESVLRDRFRKSYFLFPWFCLKFKCIDFKYCLIIWGERLLNLYTEFPFLASILTLLFSVSTPLCHSFVVYLLLCSLWCFFSIVLPSLCSQHNTMTKFLQSVTYSLLLWSHVEQSKEFILSVTSTASLFISALS